MRMIKEYIIKIDEDQSKKDIYGGYPLIEPPLELIRCKDCWKREFDNCPFNEYSMVVPEDNFSCLDGERRDKK